MSWLISTDGFVPRKDCGAWENWEVALHVVSDLLIWLAYLSIPLVLVYFARQRRGLPFSRLFVLFAAFILACGTTHLVEAVIFYRPVYHLSGVVKAVTAVVSWLTVLALAGGAAAARPHGRGARRRRCRRPRGGGRGARVRRGCRPRRGRGGAVVGAATRGYAVASAPRCAPPSTRCSAPSTRT